MRGKLSALNNMHGSLGKLLLSSPWPPRIIRILTGILFVYAAVPKLIDPEAFARVISAYGIVPDWTLPFVAVGLPLLELLAGIGMVLDVRGSLTVVTGLLLLFVVVLRFGILNNLDVDCGCFSLTEQAEHEGLRGAYYRDLVLLVAMTYLYLRKCRLRPAHSAPTGVSNPQGDEG